MQCGLRPPELRPHIDIAAQVAAMAQKVMGMDEALEGQQLQAPLHQLGFDSISLSMLHSAMCDPSAGLCGVLSDLIYAKSMPRALADWSVEDIESFANEKEPGKKSFAVEGGPSKRLGDLVVATGVQFASWQQHDTPCSSPPAGSSSSGSSSPGTIPQSVPDDFIRGRDRLGWLVEPDMHFGPGAMLAVGSPDYLSYGCSVCSRYEAGYFTHEV